MNPEEEFSGKLEGLFGPFRNALLDLAEALKNRPGLLAEAKEVEAYRVAADMAVHSVTGQDNKQLLFDQIDELKSSHPELEEQINYIQSNILI
jgi:hypothetical protein